MLLFEVGDLCCYVLWYEVFVFFVWICQQKVCCFYGVVYYVVEYVVVLQVVVLELGVVGVGVFFGGFCQVGVISSMSVVSLDDVVVFYDGWVEDLVFEIFVKCVDFVYEFQYVLCFGDVVFQRFFVGDFFEFSVVVYGCCDFFEVGDVFVIWVVDLDCVDFGCFDYVGQ